jgi:hypothetical protein
MKKCFIIFLLVLLGLNPLTAIAAWAPADLTFIELKMTGSESLVIQNTTQSTVNLQNYLVEYFNKAAPASLATPTSSQQLPAISLNPQQSILLNSDSSLICGASAVSPLGFSLSDTSGYLAIMKVDTQPDGSLIYRSQDHVSWTTATTGADLVKVPSNTADPQAVWYRKLTDGSWQQAELNGCTVLLAMVAPSSDPTFVQWASGQEPPVTFAQASDPATAQNSIPANDLGLAAPIITELLPNPAEPKSDSEDEYIELYNSNSQPFDLTGFKLEIGTSTKHFYTFPAGTMLAANGFTAFFSVDTALSLSNSGSQVWLLDPLGTVISQTDPYGTAKEGQAWALANGTWYWTSNATPNGSNIIVTALTTSKLSVGSASKSSAKTAKAKATAAKSTKTASKKIKSTNAKATQPTTSVLAGSSAAPIHPGVLAGVGAAALLYGLYEYRNDLANRFYKFRRDRAARPPTGPKP